jgi:uncharacterized protein
MQNLDSVPASTAEVVQAVKPFPRIFPAIGWIILYFVIQIIACILAMAVVAAKDPILLEGLSSGTMNEAQLGLPLMWGMLLSGLIFFAIMMPYLARKQRFTLLGLNRWSDIPVTTAVIIAIATAVAASVFNIAYSKYVLGGDDAQNLMTEMLRNIPATPLNVAVRFAAVALIAPVAEEILFRGLLQKALERHLGKWGGLILASILFGLVHGQPKALPMLALLGLALGYVYQRTGSLRLPILMHIANNAMALALLNVE